MTRTFEIWASSPRPQLLLAAHWRCKKAPASPSLSKRAALAACRWMRPESPAEFTWPYFAGLFDALGCIVCINDLILLELRHSSSSYLERLRRFLLGEAHGASDVSQLVSVRHFHRSSRLVVHEPSSRITLRRLLQAGSRPGSDLGAMVSSNSSNSSSTCQYMSTPTQCTR